MKKWKLWVAVPAVLAILALYVFKPRQYDDDAKAIHLPHGVTLIPRHKFAGKPIIDLDLFGRRLVYPRPIEMPKNGSRFGSGVVKVNLKIRKDWPPNQSPDWIDEQGEIYWGDSAPWTMDRGVLTLPFVYGTKPKSIELIWRHSDGSPQERMQFVLPAMNRKMPKWPTHRVKVGRWTVVLTPRTPLARGLKIPHDVTLEGAKPGEEYLVRVSGLPSVLVTADQPGRVPLRDGLTSNRFLVHRLSKTEFTATARRRALPGTSKWEITFESNHRTIGIGTEELGRVFDTSIIDNFLALQLDGIWLDTVLSPAPRLDAINRRGRTSKPMEGITDGRTFSAVGWKSAEQAETFATIDIPPR